MVSPPFHLESQTQFKWCTYLHCILLFCQNHFEFSYTYVCMRIKNIKKWREQGRRGIKIWNNIVAASDFDAKKSEFSSRVRRNNNKQQTFFGIINGWVARWVVFPMAKTTLFTCAFLSSPSWKIFASKQISHGMVIERLLRNIDASRKTEKRGGFRRLY